MKKKKKSNSESFIVSIGTAVPAYRYRQAAIAEFMVRYFNIPEHQARKLSIIYQKSDIEFRHSVLPDFSQNGHLPVLFKAEVLNPLLSERMNTYLPNAVKLSSRAVKNCMNELKSSTLKKLLPITHLITVSCTGMSAPGLDLQLVKELELSDDIERTSVNFMGCYAGFHALKMADAICRSNKEASVLVVMAELCSLHFQPEMDNETLVVNSLFADGAAAVLITSRRKLRDIEQPAFRMRGFHSRVIHQGEEMMTWNPSEKGFLMGLDALVPQLMEQHAGQLICEALKKFDLQKEDILYWAIHPGGRKILEAVQKTLNLSRDDLKESFGVLRNFGNMSSPTFLFVLKTMMQNGIKWKKKENILAAGFGPGITIETALLQSEIT